MKAEKVYQELVGKTYKEVVEGLTVYGNYGDCCGYYDFDVNDTLAEREDKERAILENVVKFDYSDDDSSRVVVNFVFRIGERSGLILGYELRAGSGSGWSYGAYCNLDYNGEEVASASF